MVPPVTPTDENAVEVFKLFQDCEVTVILALPAVNINEPELLADGAVLITGKFHTNSPFVDEGIVPTSGYVVNAFAAPTDVTL